MPIDWREMREPVEVYLAAIGNTAPLEEKLKGEEKLTRWERDALACLIAGKLTRPKRKRGQRTLPHLFQGTEAHAEQLKLENAVVLYEQIMAELRKRGEAYGRAMEAAEYVCEHDGIEIEKFLNFQRRTGQRDFAELESDLDPTVRCFQRWLLENGHLPEFPQIIPWFELFSR